MEVGGNQTLVSFSEQMGVMCRTGDRQHLQVGDALLIPKKAKRAISCSSAVSTVRMGNLVLPRAAVFNLAV